MINCYSRDGWQENKRFKKKLQIVTDVIVFLSGLRYVV